MSSCSRRVGDYAAGPVIPVAVVTPCARVVRSLRGWEKSSSEAEAEDPLAGPFGSHLHGCTRAARAHNAAVLAMRDEAQRPAEAAVAAVEEAPEHAGSIAGVQELCERLRQKCAKWTSLTRTWW